MADPAKDVRIAAAMALGYVGTEAAGLLLRLKARLGDRDPEVFSECLSALLTVNSKENLPFVCEYLDPGNSARCEAAVLALGKSRLLEALEPLKACWQKCAISDLGDQILLDVAMLRLTDAIDYLLELVATGSEKDASSSISALKIHNYDPKLRERLAKSSRSRVAERFKSSSIRIFPRRKGESVE